VRAVFNDTLDLAATFSSMHLLESVSTKVRFGRPFRAASVAPRAAEVAASGAFTAKGPGQRRKQPVKLAQEAAIGGSDVRQHCAITKS
jgi:hypothetical protein